MQAFVLEQWSDTSTDVQMRAAFRRKSHWVVNEPKRSQAQCYATVLGNLAGVYVASDRAPLEAVRQVLEAGLSRSAFERLKSIMNTSTEDLCKTIRVPLRTLSRRTRFKPDESERILRVAATFQRAIEVLGGLEEARRWFSAPKRALGDRSPLAYCDTEPGAREVEHLLGRIEHGVFS